MQLLLTYDVNTATPEGRRRLRNMAKLCEGYGLRVQKSVFEITCSQAGLLELIDSANRIIDAANDSVRIYRLPADGLTEVKVFGTAKIYPHSDALVL